MAKLALIAGGTALPAMIAQSCRDQGKDIFIIALRGFTAPQWVEAYPHAWVKLGQIGKVLRLLERNRCTHVVMAGAVKRPSWSQVRPDWTGLKLLIDLKRKARGDDALLRYLGNFLESKGYQLVGADTFLPNSLMPEGTLTQIHPTDEDQKDIAYALPLLKTWAQNDQGQAIVVQQGLILGVEAIEGTDELIKRCGLYKREGRGPILIKIKKPQQDRRLDMPTIGEETIIQLASAGFSGLAVEKGQSLFLNPLRAVKLAETHGIFIIGIDTP